MRTRVVGILAAAAVSLSGCSGSSKAGDPASPADTVRVVASTDVYGDIAKTIGGDAVTVTSVIDDPAKDPHSYEADAQTQLALTKAQVVIENGGGYDEFMDTMLKSARQQPTLINVTELSGYNTQPADGEFNEHLWYDFPTVAKLATQLGTAFSAAAPSHSGTIAANVTAFQRKLQSLEKQEATAKAGKAATGVAITEPVPLYLLTACGFENRTPPEFSEAIEEDTDVAPGVLKQTLDLFDTHRVELLVYNDQTGGPQTEAVLAAAQKNNVPAVPVAETLPTGKTYLSWMSENVAAICGGGQ